MLNYRKTIRKSLLAIGISLATMFAITANDQVMGPMDGAPKSIPPGFLGNMRWYGDWSPKFDYVYNSETLVSTVMYKNSIYVQTYVTEKGVPPDMDKVGWLNISSAGGSDLAVRAAVAKLKGTSNYDDPTPITLLTVSTTLPKKADSDNVVNALTVEGTNATNGLINFKAGNANILIEKIGQDIIFSPKGGAGGVTSLFGLGGDIGLKSSDSSVTFAKDGQSIDIKAKSGGGAALEEYTPAGITEGKVKIITNKKGVTGTFTGQAVSLTLPDATTRIYSAYFYFTAAENTGKVTIDWDSTGIVYTSMQNFFPLVNVITDSGIGVKPGTFQGNMHKIQIQPTAGSNVTVDLLF